MLTIFIAWMNLDLGISTCFYNGLDSFSYIWLQFVFPSYLWILTGAILLDGKFSTRVMKLLGSNPVAVLSTITLMSYYIDQNIIIYFEGKHITLVVFAICVIPILIL